MYKKHKARRAKKIIIMTTCGLWVTIEFHGLSENLTHHRMH